MQGYTIRGRGGTVKYVGITNNPRSDEPPNADAQANVGSYGSKQLGWLGGRPAVGRGRS